MVAEKLTLEEPNIVRINAVIYDEFRAKTQRLRNVCEGVGK